MALFRVQGEGIREEQKRREQTKKTERVLRAQKEDNERRRMGEKHRGGKTSTSTHTVITDELMLYAIASVNPTHASCFPAQTITHSHAQPLLPGGIDGWMFIPDSRYACVSVSLKSFAQWVMANASVKNME